LFEYCWRDSNSLCFAHVVNALLLFQESQLKAPPEKSAGLSVFSFSMAILSMPES